MTNKVVDMCHEPGYQDPVVNSVVSKYRVRSTQGMQDYGVSMAENPAGALEWLEHAQEELMDATLYIERLKMELTQLDLIPKLSTGGLASVEISPREE